MSTANPLQTLVNSAAIRIAEAQYRLANLFTPYQWNPERADFDRVAVFLDNPDRAFPAPTDGIKNSLDRIKTTLGEQRLILQAFSAQGIEPTLTADQLFATAKANVTNPSMARAA